MGMLIGRRHTSPPEIILLFLSLAAALYFHTTTGISLLCSNIGISDDGEQVQHNASSLKNHADDDDFSVGFDHVSVAGGSNKNTTTITVDRSKSKYAPRYSGPAEEAWLLFTPDNSSHDGRIPRIINKMYLQEDGQFNEMEDELKQAHQSWRNMNPGYKVRYFNLISARRYLHQRFHPYF